MELVATLLIVGVILLLLETVLPGMIAGIAGLACLVAGVAVAYARFGTSGGNMVLIGTVIALAAGIFVWMRFFPGSRLGKIIISESTVGNIDTEQPQLLHQTGTAFTNLRPSGTAVIEGRRVDVVTEGSMIAKGTPVRVVALEGMRVVVRAITADEAVKSRIDSQPESIHPTTHHST
jgi:membrane-bound serine protease (ClpP class)